MPVESASYISQLVDTNPVHTDGLNQSDAHARLIKAVLLTQFPNLGAAAVTPTAAELNAAGASHANAGVLEVAANGSTGAEVKLDPGTGSGSVLIENTGTSGNPGALSVVINDHLDGSPITALTISQAGAVAATASLNAPSVQKAGNELVPTGIISLWYGSVASIPAGWHLCDGTSGTPDLRNVFVVGAGSTYAVSQTGGAASVTTTTDTQGAHTHTGNTGSGGAATLTGSSDTQGAHSHGGATAGHALTQAELAPHTHEEFMGVGGSGGGNPVFTQFSMNAGATFDVGYTTGSTGNGSAHVHGVSTDGAHAHNISVSAVPAHQHSISSDGSHDHNVTIATLPPFVALAYIMKL